MYALLLLSLTSLTIPVFRYMLAVKVSDRVRVDLQKERQEFLDAYADWEAESEQTVEDLKTFADRFLDSNVPEDDNFHLILIDGELYRSNPSSLLQPIRPNSTLFQRWLAVTEFTRGEKMVGDPEIGSILYKADPLVLEGNRRGVFVVAHTSAGEIEEALMMVYIFINIAIAILLFSLLLWWWLAGWLMAPLRSLSRTARSISESDLTQRIPPVQGSGEIAEIAETFNAMMDRLQNAFESQRSFINDAGHELRTPLTIIQGHLELLDDDPEDRQETLELVLDEIDRMGRLVNDMILLAKSERTDFLQLETIEVSSFTEEIFAKAQTLAQRHWTLVVESRGKMVGDRQRLTGALLNLLRNAAQHTQESDTIELGCRLQKNHQVKFWVRDTGEGISPTDRRRIFDRFARGQHCQHRSEGSGLGLAIVRAIVKAHEGQVECKTQVGEGSTFCINLPMEKLDRFAFALPPTTL